VLAPTIDDVIDDDPVTSPSSPPSRWWQRLRPTALLTDPPPSRFESWWTWWLLWSAGTAFELWRVSSVRGWTSLWAEDGRVFLTQQLSLGTWRAFFTSYNGYGHLLPRLFTAVNSLFPLRDAAVLVCGEAAAVAALCAVVVARASRSLIPSWTLRLAMGATLLGMPITGVENLTNLANLQWYMMSALIWTVLWRPRHWSGRVLSVAIVLGAIGCSPLATLALPLVLWRLWVWRDRFQWALVVAAALGCWYQLSLVASLSVHHYRNDPAPSISDLLHLYGLRVAFGSFGGWTQTTNAYLKWHFVMGDRTFALAVVLTLVMAALVPTKRSVVAIAFLVASVGFFSLTLELRGFALAHLPWWSILSTGARYSVVPLMLFVGAVMLAAQTVVERIRWLLPLMVAVFVVVAYSWYPNEQATPLRTPRVAWPHALGQATGWCHGKPAIAVINVPTTPQGWFVQAPCPALDAHSGE